MNADWNERSAARKSYEQIRKDERDAEEKVFFATFDTDEGPTPQIRKAEAKYPPVHISELLVRVFPPREMLLGPWLQAKSLSMIYGSRGVGKSMLSLSIAVAVATGRSFLGWKATEAHPVLYVDGEMSREDLQARAQRFGVGNAEQIPLEFVARELYDNGMPTLDIGDVRDSIERAAREAQAKLIVLDNLSTLWRGSENEADSWDKMQDWLFQLRRSGHSVLIVHHAGKSGSQRGTSRKEDTLDVVLALRQPASGGSAGGAAFNVYFEKTRQFIGKGKEPFLATLSGPESSGIDGWSRRPVKQDTEAEQMIALKEQGHTLSQIGSILKLDKSTVSRRIRDAKATLGKADGGEHAPMICPEEEVGTDEIS